MALTATGISAVSTAGGLGGLVALLPESAALFEAVGVGVVAAAGILAVWFGIVLGAVVEVVVAMEAFSATKADAEVAVDLGAPLAEAGIDAAIAVGTEVGAAAAIAVGAVWFGVVLGTPLAEAGLAAVPTAGILVVSVGAVSVGIAADGVGVVATAGISASLLGVAVAGILAVWFATVLGAAVEVVVAVEAFSATKADAEVAVDLGAPLAEAGIEAAIAVEAGVAPLGATPLAEVAKVWVKGVEAAAAIAVGAVWFGVVLGAAVKVAVAAADGIAGVSTAEVLAGSVAPLPLPAAPLPISAALLAGFSTVAA